MSMPVNAISLAVLAAVGIGMGLYYFLSDSTEEEPLRRGSRRPANASTRIRESSPPRRHVPISNATSQSPRSSWPRVSLPSIKQLRFRKRKLVKNCRICAASMPDSTIDLNCGHIFHEECYNIWKNIMELFNSNKICPEC